MPRKRTVTAEQTETTVTQTVTLTEETAPIAWAPGWDEPAPEFESGPPGRAYRAQRAEQVTRAVAFLELWAQSTPGGADVPERLVPDAAVILRAGPGATPLEATLGRSI